ncbi:Cytosolic sulfotransferase 15, partial [Mucuna pruriens]
MATVNVTHFTEENESVKGEEITIEEDSLSQECKEFILSLPREKGWRTRYLYLFQGFWCQAMEIQAIITFQKHFQAKDNDVIVASIPKSGTTWLKALTFAIVNRHRFPTSINPLDTFVSSWIFLNKVMPEYLPKLTLEEAFDMYCKGIIGFGPTWNQMLGYWKESIARPSKVLFLKYEDLKKDVNFNVKRIAEFLGCSFTQEEESNGVVESIIKLCSFENMK